MLTLPQGLFRLQLNHANDVEALLAVYPQALLAVYPQALLATVLARIADTPITSFETLLPLGTGSQRIPGKIRLSNLRPSTPDAVRPNS